MLDSISWVLSHWLTDLVVYFALGWFVRGYYRQWRYGRTKKNVENIHEAIFHKLAAERALTYLSEQQVVALEKELNAALDEHGYDNVDCRIKEQRVEKI